jgi:hypothetical protein
MSQAADSLLHRAAWRAVFLRPSLRGMTAMLGPPHRACLHCDAGEAR